MLLSDTVNCVFFFLFFLLTFIYAFNYLFFLKMLDWKVIESFDRYLQYIHIINTFHGLPDISI